MIKGTGMLPWTFYITFCLHEYIQGYRKRRANANFSPSVFSSWLMYILLGFINLFSLFNNKVFLNIFHMSVYVNIMCLAVSNIREP